MELTIKQQKQENDYKFGPYHWFKNSETIDGRIYFGYFSICKSFIENNDKKNIKILDAGCGDGRFCKELFDLNKETEITGVDYSDKAISFSKLLLPEVNFVSADLKKIPFEDEVYDFIFLIETLEHIHPQNIDMVLGELSRVLKKDGKLIITAPSILSGVPSEKSKHYQHFSVDSLKGTIKNFFLADQVIGQDKVGFSFLKVLYKFIDNKYWDLRFLRKYYNKKIWPKFFNKCDADKGRRIIIVCQKKNYL